MKYEEFLEEIKIKEHIQFYKYKYFPKQYELWDCENNNLYLVEFKVNYIKIIYTEKYQPDFIEKLINFSTFKIKRNYSVYGSDIRILILSKDYEEIKGNPLRINDDHVYDIISRIKSDIFVDSFINIIELLYGSYTYYDNYKENLNHCVYIKQGDNHIIVCLCRDEEGYYYKIKINEIFILEQIYSKLVEHWNVRKNSLKYILEVRLDRNV